MIDVKQNNWILPLKGEVYMAADDIQIKSLQIQAAHEVPPIFHALNDTHWQKWFSQLTFKELKEVARRLEIYIPGKKSQENYATYLARYYHRRIRNSNPEEN